MSFVSLGAYRLRTMTILKAALEDQLSIYSGDVAQDQSIRLIGQSELEFHQLRNKFHRSGFVTQNIPLIDYALCRTLLLDLNPRLVHVWVLLVVRRLLGKRTILWGHAFPRAGEKSRTEPFRRMMRGIANSLVTYTVTQADSLKKIHPGKIIIAAPNSLYYDREFIFNSDSLRNSFIYVGRMHAEKKPLLPLKAFEVVAAINPRIRLILVGDGDLLDAVKDDCINSQFSDRIDVVGHESNFTKLQALYSSSIASLSPGYVGLSVTQSFSFGVPMIISRDENHAPEIEAVREGHNSAFFATDDHLDLARVMQDFAASASIWKSRGPEIVEDCRSKYSVEIMASGLLGVLTDEK